MNDKQIWLEFRGINYSANIWINGKRIAGNDYIIGSYRTFFINITSFINYTKVNILALEIFSPRPDDLSITFIDWAPTPPDDNMGIWQPIFLYSSGPIFINNIFIESNLNLDNLKQASLTVNTELLNNQEEEFEVEIEGKIENITISKKIKILPYEKKKVILNSIEFPQLIINNPRIWWPYQLGNPEMYKLQLVVRINNQISDKKILSFGIRDIQSYINEDNSRQFKINGKDIFIQGVAWTPDLMLRQSHKQDEIDIKFVKNLNMNAIRLEGKFATDYFWELCDKEGIMVIAGWPCCSHWEKWQNWKKGDIKIAEKSLRSQLYRLRNHPCLIAWFYGSDNPPPEYVERVYLKTLDKLYSQIPKISNASDKESKLLGKTGVKMSGPYSYVPPIYWYTEERPGSAFGFNTETCPDVCIPPIESLKKMFSEEDIVIGSKLWKFHCGLKPFDNTKLIQKAIERRYGKPNNIEDFTKTAQLLGYECWRAMYESYSRNYPKSTGIIGWMQNSPWPSLIWQLYDYFLNPNGAFFGAKKACESIHIQYSYDDNSIWIINRTNQKLENLEIIIKVYSNDFKEKDSWIKNIDIDKHSKLETMKISNFNNLTNIFFINLFIKRGEAIISRNFYWLTKDEDIFKGIDTFYHSIIETYADMSEIRSLPKAKIDYSYEIMKKNGVSKIVLNINNTSDSIALFLRIIIYDKLKEDFITPIYWSDNCVSVLPHEKIKLYGELSSRFKKEDVKVKIIGWNI
ncbi:MAG: hypothetical protein KGD57_01680 [Candidatus Lokiarchaeota archaeon]|nr:hypothetical protein [Candidatus Lokiarchaeota archaeon]